MLDIGHNTGVAILPAPRVKPVEITDYQRELDEKKKSIEKQILKQQDKLEKTLKVGQQQAGILQFRMSPTREKFVIGMIGSAKKVTKVQVATQSGVECMLVNLKAWDSRR